MAWIQRTTPPPNKTLAFSLKNFNGGLNNRSEQIEDNQASSLMNMRFADKTVMETRYGQKLYDNVTLPETKDMFILTTPNVNQTAGDTILTFPYIGQREAEATTSETSIIITDHGLSTGDYIINVTRDTMKKIIVVDENTITVDAIDGQVATDAIDLYRLSNSLIAGACTPATMVIANHDLSDGDLIENTTHASLSLITLVPDSDESVVFIDEFKPYLDDNVMLRATGSKFYIEDVLVTTINNKPSGTNHSGRYFFVDGTKFYVYGKFAQTTSTYEVVTGTPIDDYVLMEVVSPAAGHAQLDTSHVRGVLQINYDDFQVYYEPCKNEFDDTYSGANVVPSGIRYIASHDGRLFVSGSDEDDDNVFISDVNNPFYFPVALPIQLPPNSDKVVGMTVYDNSIVIGRHNDIYVITGATNNPALGVECFRLRKINSHTGIASNDAMKVAHNYLFFLGDDGIAYSLSSINQSEKILSTTVISKDIDITLEPLNLLMTDISSAVSYFFEDEWYVSINDIVMVYNYDRRAWTVYNGFNARSFYVINRELIWGMTNGKTATFDKENFLNFGVPYQSYWYSKRFDMDDANAYKQYREFFLVAHTYTNYLSDVTILFEIDYDDVIDQVDISSQIAIWGRAVWGDRFITRNISTSLPFMIGRRGRSIRFKIFCNHDVESTVAVVADLDTYLGKSEGTLVYVTAVASYYLYTGGVWKLLTDEQLNQRMKIYQINGEYEFRGKR